MYICLEYQSVLHEKEKNSAWFKKSTIRPIFEAFKSRKFYVGYARVFDWVYVRK